MDGTQVFLGGKVELRPGDCLDVIKGIPDASIDSVCTDPPYALVSITKRFGKEGSAPAKGGVYARASAGFMGKQWDTGERAFSVEFWAEVLRVLKPGGHVAAFAGTRTYHRLACAIEDAGFEIRDQLAWTFGQGFPKSHNAGNGWGTALKPAWEPICLARKNLIGTVAQNVLAHGTGAINIDGCRVEHRTINGGNLADNPHLRGSKRRAAPVVTAFGREGDETLLTSQQGRWPANLIHDGSDEVEEAFAAFGEKAGAVGMTQHGSGTNRVFGAFNRSDLSTGGQGVRDTGTASRFFYCAKADADARIGSKHPTVKPVDLMQWLVRLITPPGGTTLDPFAGTGTTGEAAFREGFRAILIEREAEYQADIARRMELALAGPDARQHARLKARGKAEEPGGLFSRLEGFGI